MPSPRLPEWLPEWAGAKDLVFRLDSTTLRLDAQAIVDLVFTEDTEFLDSLPASLEAALVPALDTLASLLDENAGDVEIVVASRVVRRCTEPLLALAPTELRILLERLPA